MTESSKHIDDILPIGEPRGEAILRRDRISEIVEEPLMPACQILYDKNIKTLDSTGNKENLRRGKAGIVIHYDSLSPENQRIAGDLCDVSEADEWGKVAEIVISISAGMSVLEIQKFAIDIANQFKHQPMTWPVTKTIPEVAQFCGQSESEFSLDDFLKSDWYQKSGWHFDEENSIFYLSEEHWQKVQNDIRDSLKRTLG